MIMASIVPLLTVTGCSFKLVYYVIVFEWDSSRSFTVYFLADLFILNSLGMWEEFSHAAIKSHKIIQNIHHSIYL